MEWIWCNGEFLPGSLSVSPRDRGLTHGLGIFETLLAVDGRPQVLEMHLERMRAGAERLGWHAADLGAVLLETAVHDLLKRRGLANGRARVRIALSGGEGNLHHMARGHDSLLWITCASAPLPPESLAMVTASFRRNETSPLAGIKCASYAENLLALDEARRRGADEALFYNTRGELCEGTTSNLFLVKSGRLLTPPLSSGCLPGTTRARILRHCAEAGIPAEEATLAAEDLADAELVFASSATRGVVPLRSLDGVRLPSDLQLLRHLQDALAPRPRGE